MHANRHTAARGSRAFGSARTQVEKPAPHAAFYGFEAEAHRLCAFAVFVQTLAAACAAARVGHVAAVALACAHACIIVSIFIAESTTSGSPSSTLSPSFTCARDTYTQTHEWSGREV
eukprot:6191138-Pleurochrysis_carterae.AAC.1